MILWTIFLAGLACAYGSDDRIVGGELTHIKDHPYLVSLLQRTNLGSFSQSCGGSIIAPERILTASHCVENTTPPQWRIRSGSSYHDEGGEISVVDKIIQHPDYNSLMQNDIALIALRNKLTYNNHVAPIPLLTQGYIRAGTECTIVGFGSTSEGGTFPRRMRVGTVTVRSRSLCKKAYADYNPISLSMFCAGNDKVDTCQGDSGGPIVKGGKQCGVTSWGKGCARLGYPGVYTNVTRFISWIQKYT